MSETLILKIDRAEIDYLAKTLKGIDPNEKIVVELTNQLFNAQCETDGRAYGTYSIKASASLRDYVIECCDVENDEYSLLDIADLEDWLEPQSACDNRSLIKLIIEEAQRKNCSMILLHR